MSENLIEFRPADMTPNAKPTFARADYENRSHCNHDHATFFVSVMDHTISCSLCKQQVESFALISRFLDQEYRRARQENADAYHRHHAEAEAEKQATKTRKAAYATLYRFGVTPEMYAEEYRRKVQIGELELKQDYSQTLAFEGTK